MMWLARQKCIFSLILFNKFKLVSIVYLDNLKDEELIIFYDNLNNILKEDTRRYLFVMIRMHQELLMQRNFQNVQAFLILCLI